MNKNERTSTIILAIFCVVFVVVAVLAVLKLAGILHWSWLAVGSPLIGFYVLFCAAMSCFLMRSVITGKQENKE